MQAIILCGGFGTRLRSVIGETQKTMTETAGEPFLVNVIKYLKSYSITNVIFAIGYKGEEVRNYFGEKYYFGVEVAYAEEKEPLGTGGAIRNCLNLIKRDSAVVLNGDTLFEANLDELIENHNVLNTDMSIACKTIKDRSRFGTIKLSKSTGLITEFLEKVKNEEVKEEIVEDDKDKKIIETFINGGVYVMKRSLIEEIEPNVKISLENDLIPKWLKEGKKIGGIVSNEGFIDIGTPDSLKEFKEKVEQDKA